jgi:ubiquinone/menaquinone biosynthesis C-methylase UbiE
MINLMRKRKDVGITGGFTKWYDKNTRESRMGEMENYANEVASRLKDGADVLEVAPGPGYMSITLAKTGKYNITGMDISADFVEICKKNAAEAGVSVDFRQGNVSAMPFADNSFDFIFCSAAFKNFHDPPAALREMYRVLKHGGTALIIDANRNASNKTIRDEMRTGGMRGFDLWCTAFVFRFSVSPGAYTTDGFAKLSRETPFTRPEVLEQGMGLWVRLEKSTTTP